jgi:lysozyme
MNDDLTVSLAGLKLIQSFEGCERKKGAPKGRFKAYIDPVGILTIGWGHTNATGRQFSAGDVWTQAECDEALCEDLSKFESGVRHAVKVQLAPCQFDALVSFAYNCGIGNLKSSTLLRKVNKRDFEGAAREFAKWNRAGGRILPGLTRRRAVEAILFQGAGCIEARTTELHDMPQAVDAPAKPGLTEVLTQSKIAQGTATGAALGSANEAIGAAKGTAAQLKEVKDTAQDIGLFDLAATLVQQPRFWIALAILALGAAVIYWRWRDHA